MGGFQLKNTIEGKIALFSMWDYELSYEEITALSCLTQGNLLGMSDLSIMGPANFTLDDVPCTPGKWHDHLLWQQGQASDILNFSVNNFDARESFACRVCPSFKF